MSAARRAGTAALGLVAASALAGCTLVTTLGGGAAPATPDAAPGITVSQTGSPDPSAPGSTGPVWVEQTDVPLTLGVAATIEGERGNAVGTLSIDAVTPHFEACTNADHVPSESEHIVAITFTVTADAALAGERGDTHYPTALELFYTSLRTLDGGYLSSTLGYDCMRLREWIPDVQPGQSHTGSVYLSTAAEAPYRIEWDYGHQNFVLDVAG